MPPRKKSQTVELPAAWAGEIADVAARARRSVAFVVRRALGAAPPPPVTAPAGPRAALALTTDDDDPADLIARIGKATGGRPLDEALTAAWSVHRSKFLDWAAREAAAAEAERADDLDVGLADAGRADATAERLTALAASEYVRVRTLVAKHPNTPAEVRARLAADPDRVVREAARAT